MRDRIQDKMPDTIQDGMGHQRGKWDTIERPSVWERLAAEQRPIVLYGMGDGADKILAQFAYRGIPVAGIFASDAFVRGHSFHGFPVRTFRDTLSVFGEHLVIVVAFASQRPEVMQRIADLDARFSVVVPDVPVVVEPPRLAAADASTETAVSAPFEVFTPAFLRAHRDELKSVYALWADEQSRTTFANLVWFKLTGQLAYLRASTTPLAEVRSLLELGSEEHFADLGAYTGDTIRAFLHDTGGAFGSITALEPDRRNFRKLTQYVEENLSDRADAIRLVQAGAWDCDTTLTFAAKAGRQSRIVAVEPTSSATRSPAQGVPTLMRSLDSVYQGEPCTLIKMDVEGAERQALLGARQIINRCQPKLNVAVYHRNADLFTLPLLVHDLCPAYQLYLRHHPYIPAWDTNLYAIVKKAGNVAFSGV